MSAESWSCSRRLRSRPIARRQSVTSATCASMNVVIHVELDVSGDRFTVTLKAARGKEQAQLRQYIDRQIKQAMALEAPNTVRSRRWRPLSGCGQTTRRSRRCESQTATPIPPAATCQRSLYVASRAGRRSSALGAGRHLRLLRRRPQRSPRSAFLLALPRSAASCNAWRALELGPPRMIFPDSLADVEMESIIDGLLACESLTDLSDEPSASGSSDFASSACSGSSSSSSGGGGGGGGSVSSSDGHCGARLVSALKVAQQLVAELEAKNGSEQLDGLGELRASPRLLLARSVHIQSSAEWRTLRNAVDPEDMEHMQALLRRINDLLLSQASTAAASPASAAVPAAAAPPTAAPPNSASQPFATVAPHQRIELLIVVCSPKQAPLQNAAREATEIAKAFTRAGHSVLILWGCDASQRCQRLAEHRPRYFLFSGHADASHPVSNRGTLALIDESSDRLVLLQPERLVGILTSALAKNYLQLIVINGCESAAMCEQIAKQGIAACGGHPRRTTPPLASSPQR